MTFRRWQEGLEDDERARRLDDSMAYWEDELQDRQCAGLEGPVSPAFMYAEEMKDLLAAQGITGWQPLPRKDPEKQDDLTTWLEYLTLECRWYAVDLDEVAHSKEEYNRARAELVAFLGPSDRDGGWAQEEREKDGW